MGEVEPRGDSRASSLVRGEDLGELRAVSLDPSGWGAGWRGEVLPRHLSLWPELEGDDGGLCRTIVHLIQQPFSIGYIKINHDT